VNEPMSIIAIKVIPKTYHYDSMMAGHLKLSRDIALRYPRDGVEIEAEQISVWDYERYYPSDELPNLHPVPKPKRDSTLVEVYGEPYYVIYHIAHGTDDKFGTRYLICRKAPKPAEKKADRVPTLPREYTTILRRPIDIPTNAMALLLLERLGAGNTIPDELASDLIRNLKPSDEDP